MRFRFKAEAASSRFVFGKSGWKPLLLSLLLLVCRIAMADPLSSADLKNLLAKIRERRASAPHVQADFVEEKAIRLMNKPIVSSGKVWFEAPNKFRREVKG